MSRTLTTLVFSLISLAAALVACFMWYGKVSGESARVASLTSQVQTQVETAARVAAARQALSEIAGDEAQVASYFVSEANIVSFIDDLEARGHALGAAVSVTSVSTNQSGGHAALEVSLTATGSFDAVLRTAGAIEYAPYDIVLTGFSLTKGDKTWQANMKALVGSEPAAFAASPAASSTPVQTAPPPASTGTPKSSGGKPTLAH